MGSGGDVGPGTAARSLSCGGGVVGSGTAARSLVGSGGDVCPSTPARPLGDVTCRRSTRSTTAIRASVSTSWISNSFSFERARAIIARARLELGKWGSGSGG